MTEIVAWSRDLALGYLKHPPLAAWLGARLVRRLPGGRVVLLPAGDADAGAGAVDRLAADRRIISMPRSASSALALLTLVPFFNFHALKYNVNTVLLPLWAATTLWFLRSYRARAALYAALAGAGRGAAMYGKYWSVFLLAGLVVAALIDRRRARLFPLAGAVDHGRGRRSSCWRRICSGWCKSHFAPFAYAMAVHGEKSLRDRCGERVRLSRRLARLRGAAAAHRRASMARPAALRSPTWHGRPTPTAASSRRRSGRRCCCRCSALGRPAPRSPRCGRCRPGHCCR